MAAYEGWTTELDLLTMHEFSSLPDLYYFVKDHRTKSFHRKAHRDELRIAIDSLRKGAPFDRKTRFPEEYWALMSNSPISTVLEKILTTMDLPDRIIARSNPSVAAAFVNNDAKRAFDVAMTELRKLVFTMDVKTLTNIKVFNRETFEQHMGLTWVVPIAAANR
jgi:hypothetical protein